MVELSNSGTLTRCTALRLVSSEKNNVCVRPGRGMLLADDMGLGKTIEALAGVALRNSKKMQAKRKLLPTLIVSPSDGIQKQWYAALSKSGVGPERITIFGENAKAKNRRTEIRREKMTPRTILLKKIRKKTEGKGTYILCTRHNIQSQMKMLFEDCSNGKNSEPNVLFPSISNTHISTLRNQYMAGKEKEKNCSLRDNETKQDCVRRLLLIMINNITCYGTVIIDEAHLCKNVLAYWGLGIAVLCKLSERTALLTGTPYNNGPSDMSALMTFIEPTHVASKTIWWEKAISGCCSNDTTDDVRNWRERYMLRRTIDIIKDKLPELKRSLLQVEVPLPELEIYLMYEKKCISAMHAINNGTLTCQEKRDMFKRIMSFMSCARMALIHPVIPYGRELTIQFSPSRSKFLNKEEKKNNCAICSSHHDRVQDKEVISCLRDNDSINNSDNNSISNIDSDSDSDSDSSIKINIDIDIDSDSDSINEYEHEYEDKTECTLIPLDSNICDVSKSPCRHFGHRECIERINREKKTCPRCDGLKSLLHTNLSHPVYCKNTSTSLNSSKGLQQGFTASTKIMECIKLIRTKVDADGEKIIILSFYKGGLDLIEGALVKDFDIKCARYDGDLNPISREAELNWFKNDKNCRVLLATVQSGGTGLNIVEANHMVFLDRWFNPCTHYQAEARIHRMGQKKKVEIVYIDIKSTIDIVMKDINELKAKNASIVLADGTSMGGLVTSLGYTELSGMVGRSLREIRNDRDKSTEGNNTIENEVKGEDNKNTSKPPHSKRLRRKSLKEEEDIPKLVPGEGSFRTDAKKNKVIDLSTSSDDDVPDTQVARGFSKRT